MISLAQPLHVEGHSSDPAIGDFAGTAAALHVSPPTERTEASPAIRYCVIDDDTHTSVWVAAEAIRESRPIAAPVPRTTVHGAARQPARDLARPTGRFARGRLTSRPWGGGDHDLVRRIAWLRDRGVGADAIARLLNAEAVPPPAGEAAWAPAVVAGYASGRSGCPGGTTAR